MKQMIYQNWKWNILIYFQLAGYRTENGKWIPIRFRRIRKKPQSDGWVCVDVTFLMLHITAGIMGKIR